MNIQTSRIRMESVITIMLVDHPKHIRANLVSKVLGISMSDNLYKQLCYEFDSGTITYSLGGADRSTGRSATITVDLTIQERWLMRGCGFKYIKNDPYKLPDFIIHNFSNETVGNYADKNQ